MKFTTSVYQWNQLELTWWACWCLSSWSWPSEPVCLRIPVAGCRNWSTCSGRDPGSSRSSPCKMDESWPAETKQNMQSHSPILLGKKRLRNNKLPKHNFKSSKNVFKLVLKNRFLQKSLKDNVWKRYLAICTFKSVY